MPSRPARIPHRTRLPYAPVRTPYASGHSPGSTCGYIGWDAGAGSDRENEADGDCPAARELGCDGLLGRGVGSALGVAGAGEGDAEDGCGERVGAGSAGPSPGGRVCPWASLGSGPDGCAGCGGALLEGSAEAASAEESSAPALPPADRRPWPRTECRGPSPRPSAVSPPGRGGASLPSPCRAALPAGCFGGSGSLTLIQPANEAASAETASAAAATRASGRPDGDGAGDGDRDVSPAGRPKAVEGRPEGTGPDGRGDDGSGGEGRGDE